MPVFEGILTGRFYFASRVKRLNEKTMQVVGKKVDVTDDMKRIVWGEITDVWNAAAVVIIGKTRNERLAPSRLDAMDKLKTALLEFQKKFGVN